MLVFFLFSFPFDGYLLHDKAREFFFLWLTFKVKVFIPILASSSFFVDFLAFLQNRIDGFIGSVRSRDGDGGFPEIRVTTKI